MEDESWAKGMFGKEEMDRILIHKSPIKKTRVWFIGDTGNGKTTTVGKLSAKHDKIKGKDGFSHDTKRIGEYDLNYIHKRTRDNGSNDNIHISKSDDDTDGVVIPPNATTTTQHKDEATNIIYSLVLVDTRGTSDIGVDVHYSARDLFIDMNTYYSYAEASKVVFVIMNRRLQPGQLKMIRDLYNAFQSKFLILITGTMDKDGRSRAELLKLLKANGIPFAGKMMAVDWFHHNDDDDDDDTAGDEQQPQNIVSARRSQILDAIEKLQSVNVRSLSRHGVVVKYLNHVENQCLEILRVPFAVDGILAIVAACSILLGGRKMLFSSTG